MGGIVSDGKELSQAVRGFTLRFTDLVTSGAFRFEGDTRCVT